MADADFGAFFRYHGWLAPGVRLFRRIGFPTKAACVSLAFLVPLLMLLAFLASEAMEQVHSTEAERRGVAYANAIVELQGIAQDRRRMASSADPNASLSDVLDKLQAAYSRVQALETAHGAEFGSAAAFETLRQLHQALLQSPRAADADATYAAHSAYVSALLSLLSQVADGSQLTLDPELETFHLMTLGVLRLPMQAENLGRLRGIGLLALRTKDLTPWRRDSLQRSLAVSEYLDGEIATSRRAVAAVAPGFVQSSGLQDAAKARTALIDAVGKQLLGSELTADPIAYKALGDSAINGLLTAQRAAAARLDDLLQQRIARLKGALAKEIGISLAFVALAAYLMLSFYRVMMGGLQEVSGHLKEITRGNLRTAPRPWGRDEAAQLMLTLGEMQTSLRRIVGAVLDGAHSVQTASAEIASASHDLSQRTEQTAANLEETAASMEQIAGTVKQTAHTVAGASRIVQDNATAATRGGEVIDQVVRTMQGIQDSSRRIGEIIGTIDGIAFQTNILALNAAVEAARAGEQGRGFAVVASEVRALAVRSSAAAREIKALIGSSLEQVDAGRQITAEAGATMTQIVGNAGRIAVLMGEINTATREQSTGVAQVGAAVTELDSSTQQNAALVEQTSAASNALSEQARRLAEEVSFFRIA
jgi:methyl-accepting chemotaxis protein